MGTGNNSVTSNNIKLVHYTGRWWIDCYISKEGPGWAPPSPLLAVPNVTAHPSTACVPITALLNNGPLLCGCNVPIKGLICCTSIWCWQEVVTTHSWRMQLLITHCESLNRLCECEDGSDELRNILTYVKWRCRCCTRTKANGEHIARTMSPNDCTDSIPFTFIQERRTSHRAPKCMALSVIWQMISTPLTLFDESFIKTAVTAFPHRYHGN